MSYYDYGRSARMSNGGTYLAIFMLWLPLVIWCVVRIQASIAFDIAVTGHLKRAADANTAEMAAQELDTAIAALDRGGSTKGYTSVVYETPDEDVGFWYGNLKSARDELRKVGPDTSQLERTNILLKLRETLLDKGDSEHVTLPEGISVYPDNALYGWLGLFACALACWGFLIGLRKIF